MQGSHAASYRAWLGRWRTYLRGKVWRGGVLISLRGSCGCSLLRRHRLDGTNRLRHCTFNIPVPTQSPTKRFEWNSSYLTPLCHALCSIPPCDHTITPHVAHL